MKRIFNLTLTFAATLTLLLLLLSLIAVAANKVYADPVVFSGVGEWNVVDGVMFGEGYISEPNTGTHNYKVVWSDFFILGHVFFEDLSVGWTTWGITSIYRVWESGLELYSRFSGPLAGTFTESFLYDNQGPNDLDYYSYANFDGLGVDGVDDPDGEGYRADVLISQRLDPIGGAANNGGYGFIQAFKDQPIGAVHGTFSLTIDLFQTFSPLIEDDLFTNRQCN